MTSLYFSTDEIPEEERIELAEACYSAVSPVTIKPLNQTTFEAHGRFNFLPDVSIAAVKRSAVKVEKSRSQARNDAENIALYINTAGQTEITMEGMGTVSYGPGCAFLTPTDCAGTALPSHQGIDIVLPRRRLEGAILNLDRKLKQALPDTPALGLLTHYAYSLTREERELPAELETMSSTHLTDLFVNLLGGTPDARHLADQRGVRSARLGSIKQYIQHNLTQPQLNAGLVAKQHQISERYLRALFADEHCRFSDYVLDQRLERAYQFLTDTRLSHITISAIALDSGFEDLSWFNRAFKRKYQCTLSEARQLTQENQERRHRCD